MSNQECLASSDKEKQVSNSTFEFSEAWMTARSLPQWRKRAAFCIAVACISFLATRDASACSCVGIAPEQAVYRAGIVFAGSVSAIRGDGNVPPEVEFHVEEVLKGPPDAATIVLHTPSRSGANCEGYDFDMGKTYLVFAFARASNQPASYGVSMCGGTTQLQAIGRRQRLDQIQTIARDQAATGLPPRVGIVGPRKIKDVSPVWPAQAVDRSGRVLVILELAVDASGKVSDARVLRSQPPFDEAALECVRQWEYAPTTINGVATPIKITVSVEFRR